MKYLAKYENEPLSLYGFAVIDEWKKDEKIGRASCRERV